MQRHMWMHPFVVVGLIACFILLGYPSNARAETPALTPQEQLGKALLYDTRLSEPRGQSCVVCHGEEVGFTGPEEKLNKGGTVYPGAVHTRFGNRKPPSCAYAGDSPVLYFDKASGGWIGGMFWDGRATGSKLGDPLAEQAMGPFLNPLEQNMPNGRLVAKRVAQSRYAGLFKSVWGPDSLDYEKDPDGSYERIARSIAAYERSSEVSPFTSKYDYSLKGQATLTEQEALGLNLFGGKAKCTDCHPSAMRDNGKPPLFTNFSYDNLGVPKNPANPFYTMPPKHNPDGHNWVDLGLGGYLKSAGHPKEVYEPEIGKMKTPTLRNVDKRPSPSFVKAYGHNGYFKSLKEVVHFYNTRDVQSWPAPEVAQNINTGQMGNLQLTENEEDAIVAFLQTLSDGWQAKK